MDKVQLEVNEKGRGKFFISQGDEQIGHMEVAITPTNLITYHTEVGSTAERKGLAKELLNNMVEYARTNHLKVIALCPYVHAQFKRHEDQYADIWQKSMKEEESE